MTSLPVIQVKAPTRVDLLGGTLDLWPLYTVLPRAATINAGVDLCAQIRLGPASDNRFQIESTDQDIQIQKDWDALQQDHSLPLVTLLLNRFWSPKRPPLNITLNAGSPKGAGLGGSSCLALCLAAGLNNLANHLGEEPLLSETQLVTSVSNAEAHLLHTPTGTQDHWGALRGGLNIITYPKEGIRVNTILNDPFLNSPYRMILCFSGKSRCSGLNNWDVYKKFFDRDQETIKRFTQLGELSFSAVDAATEGSVDKLLELSHQEWAIRKYLCSGIETPETKNFDRISQHHGALFSRVCGAGGGGVMTVFTPREKENTVRAELKKAGAQVFDSVVTNHGLEITSAG